MGIERASGADYWRIQLDPSATGATDGGLMNRPPSVPPAWLHYVNVESLDESMEVASAGPCDSGFSLLDAWYPQWAATCRHMAGGAAAD